MVFQQTLASQKAQMRFAKLDADADGQVTSAELEAARGHHRKHGHHDHGASQAE